MAGRSELWLMYALGGGWGHLTRAASLARAAQPRHRVRVLTNSPYARHVGKAMPELDLVALDPSLDAAAARECAVQLIAAADPGCLIVDTFPRGLGGELVNLLGSLAATKVLVHRDLAPRYVAEAGLRDFVRSYYDLILIPGEGEAGPLADLPASAITAPWVIRDTRRDARRDAPQNCAIERRRQILVCASGNRDELAWYGSAVACVRALAPKLDVQPDVRCIAPACPPGCPEECWIEHWPAADFLAGADVVIGSAGYNTIWECVAYQVPLIARPWPRKYDRQWLRARRAAKIGSVTIVKEPNEAATAAVHQIGWTKPHGIPQIRNGVYEAVALIERGTGK